MAISLYPNTLVMVVLGKIKVAISLYPNTLVMVVLGKNKGGYISVPKYSGNGGVWEK